MKSWYFNLKKKLKTVGSKCDALREKEESFENSVDDSVQQDGRYNITNTRDHGRYRKRRSNVENRVAFFAYLSSDTLHLGAGQDIVFDHAVTNIGNAYNERHGTFVAQVAGTYAFSVTLAHYNTLSTVRTWTHLVVNDTIVGKFFINDEQASQSIVVNLKSGDDVSVKNSVLDGSFTGNYLSMFSGFLLYEEFSSASIVG